MPACNRGLSHNFMSRRCVPKGPSQLRARAKRTLREAKPLLEIAVGVLRCNSIRNNIKRLKIILKTRNARQLADWPRREPCLRRLRAAAIRGGYKSFAIGIGGDIQFGIGVNSEIGVVFDVHLRRPPRVYATLGFLAGWGGSVGNDLIVSLYKAPANRIGGRAHGLIYSGKALYGGGVAAWYDYNMRFSGVSAFVSAGVGGEVGVYNKIRTKLY